MEPIADPVVSTRPASTIDAVLRFVCMLLATSVVVACPAPGPKVPSERDDRPDRILIARAEASREVNVLVGLASSADLHVRALALRGLGRVGGPRAMSTLEGALADPDPNVLAAAAAAIGVAVSLDDIEVKDLATVSTELVGAVSRAGAGKAIVVEAIGRAGDSSAQRELALHLNDAPPIAEAAAIALGRFGRRKIALEAHTCDELIAVSAASRERTVRYAAVYALSRAIQPKPTTGAPETSCSTALDRALAARVTDEDAETRAQSIAGLARRGSVAVARKVIEDALRDRDWRVAVEAVRALAGDKADDAGRDAVAAAVVRRYADLDRGVASESQIVIEGLRTLAPAGKQPVVASAAIALAEAAASSQTISPITSGWIECLAQAITIRAADSPRLDLLAGCGHGKLPDHLRLPLVAQAIEAKVGSLDARRKAFVALVSHADARIKGAALGVIATLAGGDPDNRALVGTMVTALASPDPIVAGSAVDALPALYDAVTAESRGVLDGAVVARAATETDPELAASILQLIGKRAITSGADACRAGLAGHVVRARAAVECLQALGEPSSARPAAAVVPPVDVATVIGASMFWHLTTSQGEIVIALRPDIAPWAVATIVTLTRKGFYDGLEFHRVVPDFVVQGGDPTQSGWGGPGFTTPAEPATTVDTPGYVVGGVGIADAGRDSGGSQWFIMHSRAAHLDARYTWIGSVESGQKYADALQIGDKVVRAVVEVR